ncbi:hypothetical protein K3Z96_29645, partial [Pseudomonas aeruginosa]|nr:hypothetical protein [Pseudomonas aeruginosa]
MNARVHPEATAASLSEGADYELLAQRFRPIFARIAEGAVERELLETLLGSNRQ